MLLPDLTLRAHEKDHEVIIGMKLSAKQISVVPMETDNRMILIH